MKRRTRALQLWQVNLAAAGLSKLVISGSGRLHTGASREDGMAGLLVAGFC